MCGKDDDNDIGKCGGGRLLEPTGEDEALARRSLTSSLFAYAKSNKQSKAEANEVNASSARSPGYIRWGRHKVILMLCALLFFAV